ncbi:MAG TPA: NHLP family bacteriocin export ABC transporter peptidase/permease/ATPase subunit [Bacillota bacterium]|nr:NHLP family bacteriocin export ABC transporter peptidase/permease/ATPase subunit [Bacillota bacterium]HQC47972.1 NHLP family bacteriocin export ABC transporter peptidase/permease/ATPase subunit [Bacillota bacterium]
MKKYVKTPTIFQMEGTECGAASLAMIMAYHGKYVPLDKLRVDTGVSRDGCRASKIMQGSRKYGFETEGYRMGLEALLKEDRLPCIIHWNFNHFVVFEGVKGKYAYLNDPARGRRKLTKQELDEGFTGVVLFFWPTESFTKSKKIRTLVHYARQRLKGQRSAILYLILLGLFLVFPGLLTPIFSQIFIDDILIGGSTDWLKILIIAMLGSALFQAGITFYRNTILVKLQNKMSLISTHGLLSHMFRLPMSFFDQRYAGDLASRVSNNNSVAEFIAGDLGQSILNLIVSAFYLILLLSYSPLLTLIGVGSVIINFVIIKLTSDTISRSIMKMQQDQGKMTGVIFSGINIITTLKAAGVENQFASRVLGYYAKSSVQKQSHGKLQQIINSVPQITSQICNILVLMIGGVLVIRGNLTAGMLIAFNTLLAAFIEPVNELVGFVQRIQQIKADMSRVDDILRHEEDEVFKESEEKVERIGKLSGQIELHDISFGYSKLEKPLIEGFSFKLQSGKSIAFVGASGSGKSTVSKIISGLYMPWSGDITVDGDSLRNIPLEIQTSSISTVSQEISLFSGTIHDNITMWNDTLRDEDIIQAAKDACIHEVITKRPGAYDSYLAEGGRNLSGGQRQRLEIARALVTNPTILIMDEATSALDPMTEKEIMDNIKRRGCTCIIIAHRLSAIRDCDEIIVMDRGKIIQRGTHEELMGVPGHYQKLISTI